MLLNNSILLLFKNHITTIHRDRVVDFSKLITAITELIWYISPHHSKFLAHGASLPTVYCHLLQFNDPGQNKHKINKICPETLMKLVGSVTICLEKSFTTCKSFKDALELIDKVIESSSKYHDYLESNLVAVSNYQSLEEPNHAKMIIQLPHFDGPLGNKYKSQIESSVVETIKEKPDTLDFYKPLCLDEICPKSKAHRYIFLKHVKENGFSVKNVILFTKRYGPASGYTHFVWKEEGTESLTNRQETINNIGKNLPKFFSRTHKAKSKALVSLLMHDQVSPAQFCSLYTELTGDFSIADNRNSKAVDERMQLILKTADESIPSDLRVNNGQTKQNLLTHFGIWLREKLKSYKLLP